MHIRDEFGSVELISMVHEAEFRVFKEMSEIAICRKHEKSIIAAALKVQKKLICIDLNLNYCLDFVHRKAYISDFHINMQRSRCPNCRFLAAYR